MKAASLINSSASEVQLTFRSSSLYIFNHSTALDPPILIPPSNPQIGGEGDLPLGESRGREGEALRPGIPA